MPLILYISENNYFWYIWKLCVKYLARLLMEILHTHDESLGIQMQAFSAEISMGHVACQWSTWLPKTFLGFWVSSYQKLFKANGSEQGQMGHILFTGFGEAHTWAHTYIGVLCITLAISIANIEFVQLLYQANHWIICTLKSKETNQCLHRPCLQW